VTGYGLDDQEIGLRVSVGKVFSLLVVQTSSGALSPGVKRPGSEADHSPPDLADVKKNVNLYIYFLIRLHGVAQGQLYL
jgi:hypothetical protein